VLTAKSITAYVSACCSACSDKSQSPIFKGIRTPALRQSGIKVKYVTTRSPSPTKFDISFPEKLLKIVANRGEIFSLKFGNLPPYELEGRGGSRVVT